MDALNSPAANALARKAKYSQACTFCRGKKVRCEGGHPCKQCIDHDAECVFVAKRRKRIAIRFGRETLSERLVRLEALIKPTSASQPGVQFGLEARTMTDDAALSQIDAQDTKSTNDDTSAILTHNVGHATIPDSNRPLPTLDSDLEHHHQTRAVAVEVIECEQSHMGQSMNQTPYPVFEAYQPENLSAMTTATTGANSANSTENGKSVMGHCTDDPELREISSLASDEMSNWEYNGPRSIMSISSQPGIDWVESKVQMLGVRESILRFTRDITLRMKVGPGPFLQAKPRAPEPTEHIAWLYVKAFFDRSLEAEMGIVDSEWFQNTLAKHFGGQKLDDEDPSWFALRFTVYAFGCRISLGKTHSYSYAVEASVALFENALSVQPDILQCRSSIISVRALLLMACFSEGIGSPHLEYTLASNAMRLAIAKGLHCQPASTWKLSQQEIRQRSRLFWNLYTLDRQIASRSGRPPAIDDDEISCEVPDGSTSANVVNITFTAISIRLGQIQSRACKRLSSARARRQSTAELIRAVTELNDELDAFKRSIEPIVSFDDSIDDARPPPTMTMFQLIMIYFLYYGVVFDIHSPLLVPWFDYTGTRQLDAFQSQVEDSCGIVVQTARAVILASRLIHLGPNTPVLLALYAPHRALIMLFIHILSNPGAKTAQSDLVLMGIASGFASRLEFETCGSLRFQFVREWAVFASAVVSRTNSLEDDVVQSGEHGTSMVMSSLGEDAEVGANTQNYGEGQCFQEVFDPAFEVDMELWSTLVPVITSEDIDMGPFAT